MLILWKINRNDKSVAIGTKKKDDSNKIRNKCGNITKDFSEMKKIMRAVWKIVCQQIG